MAKTAPTADLGALPLKNIRIQCNLPSSNNYEGVQGGFTGYSDNIHDTIMHTVVSRLWAILKRT